MNLQNLPENESIVFNHDKHIKATATRISQKKAILVYEIPNSNMEVLRANVDVVSGETAIESFRPAFWKIRIDGVQKSDEDLHQFIGKSVSMHFDFVEKSFEATTLVHHYTNINSLALILKHKKIRFNRLDYVDDISETQSFGKINLAHYLFVSCWTDSSTESIPQWHMYTDRMAGVRLTFPKNLFNYLPLKPPASWNAISEGTILSPIRFERLFTNDYIILPNILNKEQFERKIQYVDDISSIYRDAVDLKIDQEGYTSLKINNIANLAGYKQKVWEFQSELRFVLFILPAIPIPNAGMSHEKYVSELPNHILNSIVGGIPPKINYFDVDINPNVLDNCAVTMGPLSTEGDIVIVESLLKEHTKQGSIRRSALTGTIRNPVK